MTELSRDVIILPETDGRWVLMNVAARKCLGVDGEVLRLLDRPDEITKGEKTCRVWEIGWFSNYEGLLADPTRYRRRVSEWPAAEELKGSALTERLKRHLILIDDPTAYRARFDKKASLLDTDHLGNFHQQLGQELFVNHREDPAKWWLHQKFNEDLKSVRSNLYGAVQKYEVERYFKSKFKAGDSVVDMGCGTGYYSNRIAETGAAVLGVDPSEAYVQAARKNAVGKVSFEVRKVGYEGALDFIPSGSVDYVYMSDALLFYFTPALPNDTASLEILLRDIRRILKPGGSFISVEPHFLFWLAPWLGDPDRPFTVIHEYRDRKFGVAPNLSRFVQACSKGGFAVTWIEELSPDPAFEAVDARAYHFAREFPLWQLFEMRKAR